MTLKKPLVWLLTAVMLFCLTACGGDPGDSSDPSAESAVSDTDRSDTDLSDTDPTGDPSGDSSRTGASTAPGKTTGKKPGKTTRAATTAATKGSGHKVVLIRDGKFTCPVVWAGDSGNGLSCTVGRLRAGFARAAGEAPEFYCDSVEPDSGAPEILLGETDRPESRAARKKLGKNGYSVTVSGDRVVIVGANDSATALAADAFVRLILGGRTDGGLKNLSVYETVRIEGVYTPDAGVGDPAFAVVPEQDVPTVSPAAYPDAKIQKRDGGYTQTYPAQKFSGVRTTFQTNVNYDHRYQVNADSVMVYSTDSNCFYGWYEGGDYVIDMMLAINRADRNYLGSPGSARYGDIQKGAGGQYLEHGGGDGWYYMVPTEDWIDYAWEHMIRPMIEKCHPQTVAMEEPEMWLSAGYSDAFKREWKAYYREEWQDPNSSAEATLKSNLLKTYLFERIIRVLSTRIKEASPSTQVYIATHSTPNYTLWGITAGLDHYVATGVIDGVIGQTWSDTTGSSFPYAGTRVTDHFTNAYLDYVSYTGSCEGIDFYALADPMADNGGLSEESCQYAYRQAVAAQLLDPMIHRFEILPWVQRAYGAVSYEYRTVQSQVFAMLNAVSGKAVTLRGGTPGITFLLSDSLSWMNAGNGFARSTTDSFYGVCAPLVRDGIPLRMQSLDQLTAATQLDGTSLAVVCFDSSVPLSEKTNAALAAYVRSGGTLLCLTGSNRYWDITDYFFWKSAGSPLNDLLTRLGLSKIRVSGGSGAALSSSVKGIRDAVSGQKLTGATRDFSLSFTGGSKSILTAGSQIMGIDEAVGKGHFVCVGVPSAWYADTAAGAKAVRALTAYALGYTGYSYTAAPALIADRGDYTVAHAFREPVTVKGQYIDLFSDALEVLTDPTVPREDSLLLKNITALDRSVPRLGVTSGEVIGKVSETAGKLTYTVRAAYDTILTNRILLPKGVYPTAITAVTASGNEVDVFGYDYDAATASCCFRFMDILEPAAVTVTFGGKADALPAGDGVFAGRLTGNNNTTDFTAVEAR